MSVLPYKKPDFEQDDDIIMELNATMIQLRARAESAEHERNEADNKLAGWLRAEELTFKECGRLIDKNNKLIRDLRRAHIYNKQLEAKINQLNERIGRLITWKKKTVKKWVKKLEAERT